MWLFRFFTSSIGKKILMAATGLLLMLFLVAHAVGNAAIFFGSAAFQAYADALHGLPVVVFLFGLGLLVIFLVHITIGIQLFLQNRKSAATQYAVYNKVRENTFASSTMPYTGLFIFVFVLIHVFGFGINPGDTKISVLVSELLGNFFYGLFYLFSFCVLALHLSHGFWSMLQTFGVNHPRYNEGIARLTFIVPGFFLVFFGSIVLYFMTGIGANY
ncbi:succinate dehydrogenase cytochrome b subunit [Desulfopila inferna]|uniref:succinate dehydrogenase cytochrome b subunit n=1 Tax=Desulfopila inferna TaxID=468528 RepID=UPI001962DB0A|nr:succinate dehydrogenase cytochrome b subunit [Desulfopila inferna]MBM9602825.1 succinate dehydrogenase cytochrome b subunit [Desulfopila inferna]